MTDYDAPEGPPPPKVPEGWIVKWNEQYKEWFFVNKYTKKSQWDKPTAPAVNPNDDDSPAGPPPGYTRGSRPSPTDSKNNPFLETSHTGGSSSSKQQEDEDARLARQLQDEEDAKARGPAGSGAAASYANTPLPPGSNPGPNDFPDQLPPRDGDKGRGLLGKLFGGKNKPQGQQYYGPPPQQPMYGGPQQGGYYGGPPGPAYGGYPPPGGYGGYGGYPPQGGYYGGGYPPQQPGRTSGGMGAMGGAALGLGGGLIGGMLLEDAIHDHDQSVYDQGYQNGEMNDMNGGGMGGGDMGGGDMGGGDMGGGF